MTVVIDDRLLLDVLAGAPAESVAVELGEGGVFTTSAWYYRLGRAAFSDTSSGALSSRLAGLSSSAQSRVRSALVELPANIGLLHGRITVPVMVTLRSRRPLNLLGAEALATGMLLSAMLVVTTDAPLLRIAANDAGVDYRLLA